MRNRFSIHTGDKVVSVHNTVLSSFEHWQNGLAYADYMSIMGGEHRLDKRTEVISYNDDVLKGELFATYRVYVNQDEFPYDIDKIGLAPGKNADLSNECVVSVPAASHVIFATVYLEPETDDVALYPGANKLVRSLLGMETKPEFSVFGGSALLPNRPIMCDTSSYTKLSSTALSGGVRFKRGTYSDFAVGDPPVLRFNAAYANLISETNSRLVENGGVFLSGTTGVSLVKKGDEQIPFGCTSVAKKFHPSGKNFYDTFPESSLISDPLGNYAAVVRSDCIMLIGEDGSLTRRSYIGNPMLCSDGTIVSKMGGYMYFWDLDKEEKSVSIAFGDYVALSSGGGYDVFVYNDGALYLYRYDGTLSLKSHLEIEQNYKLTRLSDFAVALNNGKEIRLFTANGEIEPYETLSMHVISEDVADGCFYGKTYMGNVLTGKTIACTNAFGRFCNTSDGLYYMGESGSVKVGDFVIQGAAVKGDTAYFLCGGRLLSYVMEKSGTFLSVDASGEVSCEEVTPMPSGTTVTLTITKKEVS